MRVELYALTDPLLCHISSPTALHNVGRGKPQQHEAYCTLRYSPLQLFGPLAHFLHSSPCFFLKNWWSSYFGSHMNLNILSPKLFIKCWGKETMQCIELTSVFSCRPRRNMSLKSLPKKFVSKQNPSLNGWKKLKRSHLAMRRKRMKMRILKYVLNSALKSWLNLSLKISVAIT